MSERPAWVTCQRCDGFVNVASSDQHHCVTETELLRKLEALVEVWRERANAGGFLSGRNDYSIGQLSALSQCMRELVRLMKTGTWLEPDR